MTFAIHMHGRAHTQRQQFISFFFILQLSQSDKIFLFFSFIVTLKEPNKNGEKRMKKNIERISGKKIKKIEQN